MAKKKISKPAKSSLTLDRMAAEIVGLRKAVNVLEEGRDRTNEEIAVKFATITQVADLFTILRRVLNSASAELAGAASYTQQEIARMSADEYREKVLVPLNIGRRV